MENTPLVSVVLPAFNAEKYLADAIASILSQTYKNFELILLNDGSTDSTETIIRSFTDNRIHYVDNGKNIGLIASLNQGIDLSKGKYIVRMDADDISLPERIEKQVAFMEANPKVGAAGCQYYSFSSTKLKKIYAYTESEILRSLLLFKSCLCHPTAIIRKEILTEHKIKYKENYKHAEDYDFWIQISKVSKLGNVKEFLFKYRNHDKQVSTVHTGGQKGNSAEISKKYLSDLGFSFTEHDLKINSIIATNQLIKSESTLTEIEQWLLKLIEQNNQLKSIETNHFNFLMGKTWFDSCGITNLGRTAYTRYFKSKLSTLYPISSKEKIKLASKCAIRSFKK